MNCLLIYDIPDDRVRVKVADMCMDYGMNRIQYSAFIGNLHRTHQQELIKRAVAKLGKKPGKIYLYCIGEKEWDQRLEHVRAAKPDAAAAAQPTATP